MSMHHTHSSKYISSKLCFLQWSKLTISRSS
nr:MAG TPA: hypothetical protein [Podoviridae sp. ctY3D12]